MLRKTIVKGIALILVLIVGTMFIATGCATQETAPKSETPQTPKAEVKEPSPQKQEKIILRYSEVNADNDPETQAAYDFAKRVKEKSNGRIEVQIFPNGQLGGMKDIIQSLQMGAVDMARNNPSWLADAGIKKLNVLSLPYIFNDIGHANKVIEGPVGKQLLDEIKNANMQLVGLGYYEPTLRHFFFTNKRVTKLSDLKGLKLRVPTSEMYKDMVEAFGASPTPIAYGELYSALQTGVVDGAENPLKGYYNMKFYEVAKKFTFDAHQYETSIILFSEMVWNKLSEDDKKLITEAFNESAQYYKEMSQKLYDEYLTDLEKQGVEFSEVENTQEWQDAVKHLYDKYGVGMEDIIDQIKNTK
ncbi:TRAP transporter substrate-binding protein [Petroclostridium sp. X23]|uniref:TRAP transporter substrate-binding protein n=1 Tax=Petroclostridium sp. X23 TaxID=3045146 RepID=UPI0024ADA42C|nr:TRAP transporter substrate-binding protein [Petroclostridium sp. X23]WHH58014.1 TRAP transporter substrate-binding protein [Petroclostridium sp. X23]